ncbi:Six-hairpin glycosidase-like protein [Dactylonectria estremocensis]|uniref:Trehalase n=1 Tax=Dactylonectria estremocensis TaxID=1079267 RepID=A0A9P9FE72_9HYPO|nr:Six-hairpin glycosidase-like protein [Dactylonectria estremocensis]
MASLRQLATAVAATSLTAVSALYTNGSVIAPCDSPVYCHGDILAQVELARPFSDSKTFVDMPAIKPLSQIQQAFDKLDKPLRNNSALNEFLDTYFGDAGGELEEVSTDQLKTDPVFLDKVNDTVIKQFTQKVIKIWPDLTRRYSGDSNNCTECPNSFLPVNRTFVVAGGRFREPYYWDSYWILEGLLRTGGSFTEISKNAIENFLDFVEQFGFVPNGARVYYLNRSQPPLLSQMVKIYIEHTNDTDILDRALPLLVKEHEFWMTNRTVDVTVDNSTYTLNRYAVSNTQPRPESYREDYVTANNASYYAESGIIYPENEKFNETQKQKLYANLASGAESGWDYSARWISRPNDAAEHNYFPLRYLNVKGIVPVDLNSILYGNEIAIADFFEQTGNDTASSDWRKVAESRSKAMHAVMWNDTLFSYFDFNLTSGEQNIYYPADSDTATYENETAPAGQQVLFSVAQFYPFWLGAAPKYLKENPYAVLTAFRRVVGYLDDRKGGIPATNFRTSEQWDQPNVWPPLMHILMAGLQNTPATFGKSDPSYQAVHKLALRLAQRYLDSTFCTWYATGGSTSDTPQLEGLSADDEGIMFEKYADNATNVAGGGGEYEVVEGFGWTNGVLLWAVDTFGDQLKRPDCGDIKAADINSKRSLSAVILSKRDANRVKKFGRRLRAEKRNL